MRLRLYYDADGPGWPYVKKPDVPVHRPRSRLRFGSSTLGHAVASRRCRWASPSLFSATSEPAAASARSRTAEPEAEPVSLAGLTTLDCGCATVVSPSAGCGAD